MSEKYKINDKKGVYFVTLTTVDWIDIFTRRELKLTIIDPTNSIAAGVYVVVATADDSIFEKKIVIR